MGIRFYCPNGHKLNVKEFQAGRKGICPYCASKFVVPLESTRKGSKELREDQAATAAAGGAVPEPPVTPDPQAGAAATPADAGHMPDASVTESQQEMADLAPKAQAAGAAAPTSDPLMEAGDAVWYVRPPAGGQFGPAAPEIMREWINEGRVSADSLVWREGWRDWQEASSVFPQFSASKASARASGGTAGAGSAPSIDTTTDAPVERTSTPWRPKTVQAAIISALMLGIIILLAIFMFVLFRNPEEESPPVEAPPANAASGLTDRTEFGYPPPLRLTTTRLGVDFIRKSAPAPLLTG